MLQNVLRGTQRKQGLCRHSPLMPATSDLFPQARHWTSQKRHRFCSHLVHIWAPEAASAFSRAACGENGCMTPAFPPTKMPRILPVENCP